MMLRGLFTRPQVRPFSSNIARLATHRELGPRWNRFGSGGSGGGGAGPRWWSHWKVPLAFTAGVIAFDYFALPRIMDLPVLKPLKRQPELLVSAIIGLNVAAFLAWRMPGAPGRFMARYGLLQKTPAYFSGWQLLGSAFSHQNFWHLFINMFVLWQFATPIAHWMGPSLFLETYLDSCVLSSLGSMLLPALLRRPVFLPSLGASGAVFSCLGVFSYLVPDARLALWFVPLPIGAWSVFLLTLGYNAFAMVSRRGAFMGAGIDYAGHVAGSCAGIFYGWVVQQRIRRRRERMRRVGIF